MVPHGAHTRGATHRSQARPPAGRRRKREGWRWRSSNPRHPPRASSGRACAHTAPVRWQRRAERAGGCAPGGRGHDDRNGHERESQDRLRRDVEGRERPDDGRAHQEGKGCDLEEDDDPRVDRAVARGGVVRVEARGERQVDGVEEQELPAHGAGAVGRGSARGRVPVCERTSAKKSRKDTRRSYSCTAKPLNCCVSRFSESVWPPADLMLVNGAPVPTTRGRVADRLMVLRMAAIGHLCFSSKGARGILMASTLAWR